MRLRQGDMAQSTTYADDPVDMVKRWRDAGARRLHVVDLDGAIAGKPLNRETIERMVHAAGDMPVQIGGGIRELPVAKSYIDVGISFVIVGTKAVASPAFVSSLCEQHPGQVIVGLDSRDGNVSTDGWLSDSGMDVVDLARQLHACGVSAFIHTDIARDGMLSGVNMTSTIRLAKAVRVPVFASGGVANLDDIRLVADGAEAGVAGVVVGRAIYEGSLDFRAAQQLADQLVENAAMDESR